jgi:mannose-6-phosphate isomerase
MEVDGSGLLGSASASYSVFPWLIKFLDANDWLSVQVHPNEAIVKNLLSGEGSKTEAWFVIEARHGSRIYAGLRSGITAAHLRAALASGGLVDCLHSFAPRPGDCVFLPAGTVHAVGGGVVMAEIQQTSDATFRLFDWKRVDAKGEPRRLHIEEAFASIDWGRGPIEPVHVDCVGRMGAAGQLIRQDLVRCPYFELSYVETSDSSCWGDSGRLQALIILEGAARWSGPAEELVNAAQVWLLPAAMPRIELVMLRRLKLLACTLPGQ